MWKSDRDREAENEFDRQKKLLSVYEAENLRLKNAARDDIDKHSSQLSALTDKDRLIKAQQKQIRSLQMNIKADRIAMDGITKKAGVLEYQLQEFHAERVNLIEERNINKKRVKEVEQALNDDRTKRLQEMHQIEQLIKKNAELEARESWAEHDALKANEDSLKKIQKFETLQANIASLQKTIDTQALELLNLTRDSYDDKERHRKLSEDLLSKDSIIAERTKERDFFSAEVSRLRTELVMLSQTHGERSLAYSRAPSRASTRASSRPMTKSLSESHFFTRNDDINSSFNNTNTSSTSNNYINSNTRSGKYSDNNNVTNAISPVATAMRPYTANSMNFSMSTLSLAPIEVLDNDNDNIKTNDINGSTNNFDDTGTTTNTSIKSTKSGTNISSKKNKNLSDNRSMFLGSGLGLKKDPVSTTPKGSAKMILKKIMSDFEDGKFD